MQLGLVPLPLLSYAVARVLALLVRKVARRMLQYRPRMELLTKGFFGWPLSILFCVMLNCVWPLLGVASARWNLLLRLPHFWPTSFWLVAAGISMPILDGALGLP